MLVGPDLSACGNTPVRADRKRDNIIQRLEVLIAQLLQAMWEYTLSEKDRTRRFSIR